MNDRFKFRAWFNGRFIYKSLWDSNVYTEDDKCICLANTLPTNLPWEQCTGLEDKNGTLIYERDIVIKDGSKYQVVWVDTGLLGFYLANDIVYTNINDEIEVIGNTHENPELMEE